MEYGLFWGSGEFEKDSEMIEIYILESYSSRSILQYCEWIKNYIYLKKFLTAFILIHASFIFIIHFFAL